jgi:hypothetical protein
MTGNLHGPKNRLVCGSKWLTERYTINKCIEKGSTNNLLSSHLSTLSNYLAQIDDSSIGLPIQF